MPVGVLKNFHSFASSGFSGAGKNNGVFHMLAGNHGSGALCLANPKMHAKRADTHPNAVAKLAERYARCRAIHAQVLTELRAHPELREQGRCAREQARAEKRKHTSSPLVEGIVKTGTAERKTDEFGHGNASVLAGKMCC